MFLLISSYIGLGGDGVTFNLLRGSLVRGTFLSNLLYDSLFVKTSNLAAFRCYVGVNLLFTLHSEMSSAFCPSVLIFHKAYSSICTVQLSVPL